MTTEAALSWRRLGACHDAAMGAVRWTPELGTRALVAGVGAARALALLGPLVAGRVSATAMVDAPYDEVIRCIGRCEAAAFLRGGSADHLAYWPRSWAARSLAHLGDESASPWLVEAFGDPHWRVRMAAVRALGRLAADGHDDDVAALVGDAHPRVRAAAVVALGRTGYEFAIAPLRAALEDVDAAVRRSADRGLAQVESRLGRQRR